jgi:hypothetical protein
MALISSSPRRALVALLAAAIALFALAPAAQAGGGWKPSVGGKTTLALDPGTAGALTSLGISVAPVAPATAGAKGVSFPITGAAPLPRHHRWHHHWWGHKRGHGPVLPTTISHSGGLALSSATTTVTLTDYTIVLGDAPNIVATVNGGPRVSILSLDLSQAEIKARWHKIVVKNVKAALTAEAAGALNAAFGTDKLAAGLPVGTAKVKLRLR